MIISQREGRKLDRFVDPNILGVCLDLRTQTVYLAKKTRMYKTQAEYFFCQETYVELCRYYSII